MKRPNAAQTALLPLLLALSAHTAACDDSSTDDAAHARAAVEIVETLQDDDFVYQIVEVDGERRVVVDAERGGRRVVMVADASGEALAVAVIDAEATRRLDVDRVLAGELDALAQDEADEVSELVLAHFVESPDSFRRDLTAVPRTQAMAWLNCLMHILFGNPDLMHPDCVEFE